MKNPKAILISDVHYSLSTLDRADYAFRQAILKAYELGVPLIDCGDLTNDKAIIRGEVANKLLHTLLWANNLDIRPLLLVGNHSLINEKGQENSINFLSPYADIIKTPLNSYKGFNFIPYQNDPEAFREALKSMKSNIPLICHQGILGANMGGYIQDHSAIALSDLDDHTVFSGHYHRHQQLSPRVTYVGNPYTLTYGETEDGPKGYLILNEDYTASQAVLSDLPKHIKYTVNINDLDSLNLDIRAKDYLWLKVLGSRIDLSSINKQQIADSLKLDTNFKLELIPTEDNKVEIQTETMTNSEILDKIIDETGNSENNKDYLKRLYREVIESNT